MNFLFDIAQEGRLRSTRSMAERASEKVTDQLAAMQNMQRRLDVLALASQALFEMLQDRLGLSEEEVILKMAEIDSRDGKADGKMSARVASCGKCHRPVSTARQRCLYCGEIVTAGHLFEKT